MAKASLEISRSVKRLLILEDIFFASSPTDDVVVANFQVCDGKTLYKKGKTKLTTYTMRARDTHTHTHTHTERKI